MFHFYIDAFFKMNPLDYVENHSEFDKNTTLKYVLLHVFTVQQHLTPLLIPHAHN